MFGQGCPFGVPDFGVGAGVLGVEVVGGAGVCVEVVGAAAAPAIPAIAPPVASTPITIVALSSFEMCIGSSLLSVAGWCSARTLHADPKRSRIVL